MTHHEKAEEILSRLSRGIAVVDLLQLADDIEKALQEAEAQGYAAATGMIDAYRNAYPVDGCAQ